MRSALVPVLLTPSYSLEARAFFARLTPQPSASRKRNYDTLLIRPLVLAGTWAKLDILGVGVPGDEVASLTNLIQSSYGGTNTSATFSNGRFTGNGTSAYIDLGFNPTTASSPKFVQDSASFGVYSLKLGQDTGGLFGPASGTPKNSLYPRYSDDLSYYRANVGTSSSLAALNNGLVSVDRSASTVTKQYRGGYLANTGVTNASSAPDNANLCLLRDRTLYSTGIVAGWFVGQSLSAADHALLNTCMTAFLTAEGVIASADISPYIIASVADATNLNGPEDLLIIGNYAYVPCRDGATLTVVDISNPMNPFVASVFTDADLTQGMGIAANGSTLFLTSWHNHKLISINGTNPLALVKISSITIGNTDPGGDPDELRKVAYQSGYCFCTHVYDAKLYIVNVSDPANMSITSSLAIPEGAFAVAVSGNYAYVAGFTIGGGSTTESTKVNVVDHSTKASPSVVKTLTDATNYLGCSCLFVSGTHLLGTFYAADRFVVFNIADPPNMARDGLLVVSATLNGPNRLFPTGSLAYVAAADGDAIGVIDWSTPATPTLARGIANATLLDGVYSVALSGSEIYAVARNADRFIALR
jgi:hypothetical protein